MTNTAIVVIVDSVRTRASTNEALVTFAVPLEQANLVSTFMGRIGQQVGLAFADVTQQKKHAYGVEAQKLKLSGFCRSPAVWEVIGQDSQFLAWVRAQPCIIPEGPHEGDIVAAHVRRVADGAGTGIKPEFSAVPMCARHHREQHQHGESVLGGKEKFDAWRIETVERWAWEMLRAWMGYESMADVPPPTLRAWARDRGVDHLLPAIYR